MVEADLPATDSANIVLSCDANVVFRRRDTLWELARVFVEEGAPLLASSESTYTAILRPRPDSSPIAVRRDCYSRKDIAPWAGHGPPAYWMQRSIWRAELPVVYFPSHHGGYILHRGRSGVAGARLHFALFILRHR